MKFLQEALKNNWIILCFSLVFFCFFLFNFLDFEPHHDQAFHITWFQNLKASNHLITDNFFYNFKYLLIDEKGFIHELFKPANNPKDYHAYLFQINSVLVIYLISFLFNLDSIQIYNFTSILFATISIILNYQILIYILNKYNLFKNSFSNKIIYQIIFCLLNISFYKYYFSPLGHHNIAYFFFALTILLFLKELDKNKPYKYIRLGFLSAFAVYFQVTIALLLLPFFSLMIIFENRKISFINITNFFKFFFSVCALLTPFLFLIINNFITSHGDFFSNLIGGNNFNFYFEKINFWFLKLFSLSSPIIFLGFISSFFISFKLKKFNNLYLIILIHFFINIILSIFYISYLRNFYYIFNIILIFSSFAFIFFYYYKNNLIKILSIFLIIISSIYNFNLIFDVKKLEKKENLFYKIYFENQGNILKKINKIKLLSKDNKIVFFSDLSKNYISAFDINFLNKKNLIKKPILNLSNHVKKSTYYSNWIINNHKIIDKNFILISISEKFEYQKQIFKKLKNHNFFDKKCKIKTPHILKELIFRDSSSGNYNVKLYLTNIKCNIKN